MKQIALEVGIQTHEFHKIKDELSVNGYFIQQADGVCKILS